MWEAIYQPALLTQATDLDKAAEGRVPPLPQPGCLRSPPPVQQPGAVTLQQPINKPERPRIKRVVVSHHPLFETVSEPLTETLRLAKHELHLVK
jgi:hypothetical protein